MGSLLQTTGNLQGLLPLLLNAAVKGALLIAVAAIAAYALRKKSAASRHAVWSAAVIGHLAIPVFMVLLPAWRIPLLPAAPWQSNELTPPASMFGDVLSPGIVGNGVNDKAVNDAVKNVTSDNKSPNTEPAARGALPSEPAAVGSSSITSPPMTIFAIVATIWFVGATLVLLRLALGTWQVGRLAKVGARVEDGAWLSLTQRLANRLGVSRPLTLLRGDRLAVPVTWGIVYPAVLLPQDSDNWTEEQRRFVLVHEMAHVKRFDALTQLLAQFAVAVFWFDPLVWIAAHQMRVEREHACDDYVLRDGTTPSLYAGELLEMVRNIGTPQHDRAAPAFAALAMARRSEFEGRMLAILDPRLDRNTLNRRGAFMTAVIVALLTLPLAALRPFQQPRPSTPTKDEFPSSFKVTISDGKTPATPPKPAQTAAAASATTASTSQGGTQARWTCEKYPTGTELHGSSTHISEHTGEGPDRLDLLFSDPGHCTEAAVIGKIVFSPDERRVAQLAPGGFARFRERTASFDRAVSITPVGDGSLNYTALVNGQTAPFDASMQAWLEQLLPTVLREIPINVPERVARFRAQGGVPAVLQEIGRIRSSGAKRAHYEELIKNGPTLSDGDMEKIIAQVSRDLTSSGDLSAVLQMLPRKALQNPGARRGVANALSRIQSSGDKVSTLQTLAPSADPELLLLLVQAAAELPSSGDKANFLIATAAEYLNPRNAGLRTAYFRTTSTLQSSGDMANVLLTAMPYGHADPQIAVEVVKASEALTSSGDAANVLLGLVGQRLLQPSDAHSTLAAIQRTLTMQSSGDRANVLMSIAGANLLTTRELKDAFTKAALALPSDADRANVLATAAKNQ
ncbi:MAG TPA: M56 family metallopeptidase [Gemmatimonadaceae bacterium]|nr:M56 family metallopeptidase [Gemmatimonadaceae bacterium]